MFDAEDVSLDVWEAWCRWWKVEKTGHVRSYVYDTLFVFGGESMLPPSEDIDGIGCDSEFWNVCEASDVA